MKIPHRLYPVFAGCIVFPLVWAFFTLTDTGKELIERVRIEGKLAAEPANARAMFEYYQKYGGEEWLRKAAEGGYAEAQRRLGFKYHYGTKDYPLDPAEAAKWYTLAAAQGDHEAEEYLDKLNGVVSAQNEAERGDAETQYRMAVRIGEHPELEIGGFSSETRAKEALKWYRKAAENGHKGAQFDLAEGYAFGAWFARQDFEEAAKWYRKLAEQGDPMGQGMLGWLYATGRGVPQDRKTAVEWFRKGAAQGNAESQFGMGISIEERWLESSYLSELENWKTVMDWYLKAAGSKPTGKLGRLKHGLGKLYPPTTSAPQCLSSLPYKIGHMYADRYCLILDSTGRIWYEPEPKEQYLSEAVKWYMRAVEADDLFGVFELRYLADMRDSEEAKEALRKLAENGDEYAKAYLVEFGWAAPEDMEPLLRWSAERGNDESQYKLARLLIERNNGITPEAMGLLSNAAEKGNNEARYKLACLLIEQNNGITPEAMELLLNAARDGHNPALRELVGLAANGNKEPEDAIRTISEDETTYVFRRISRERAQKLMEDYGQSGQWRWQPEWDDPPEEDEEED